MLVVDIQESHRSKIYSFTSFYGQGRYNEKALGSLFKKNLSVGQANRKLTTFNGRNNFLYFYCIESLLD